MTTRIFDPFPQFFDSNGDPLSGGKLYFYSAGTSTPKDTYSDAGLTVVNPNPVVLNSAGRPAVSGNLVTVYPEAGEYKVILTDSADVTIWTVDSVDGADITSAQAVTINAQTASHTATSDDYGAFLPFTISAAATLTLPAVSGVPAGTPLFVRNSTASSATLTIDGNGSETINDATTQVLFPGEGCTLYASASGWYMTGVSDGWRTVRKQAASAASSLDFLMPSGFRMFRLTGWFLPGTDNTYLAARCSSNGGTSYDAGASDYAFANAGMTTGSALAASTTTSTSLIAVTGSADNAAASGVLFAATVFPGDGTRPFRINSSYGGAFEQGAGIFTGVGSASGHRQTATAMNAVRLLPSSGTWTGYATLEAIA